MAQDTLSDLIGAVLASMVNADAQAAMATMKFIESFGFTPGARGAPGILRMVRFEYDRSSPDGMVQRQTMRLPLLSLVPIPTLHIERGDVEFDARIQGVRPAGIAGMVAATGSPMPAPELVASIAPGTRAAPAALAAGGERPQATADGQMHIRVELKRADLAAGTISLLGLMGGLQQVDTAPKQPAGAEAAPREAPEGAAAQASAAAHGPAAQQADVTPTAPFEALPNETIEEFVQRYRRRFPRPPASSEEAT